MRRHIYPLLLLLISIVTHHIWITNFSPLVGGDTIYFNRESLADFYKPLSLWVNSYLTTGALYITAPYYPMFFLLGFLGSLGLNYELIERIVYMWPIVVIAPLGSYCLVRYILKSEFAAFIGSLVFTYNTYTLVRNSDQLPITVAFTLSPVILLLFIRALVERKLYQSIAAGFILLISSFFDFRISYVIAGILFLYFCFHLIFLEKRGIRIFRSRVVFLIPLLILLFGNMYWFISIFLSNNLTDNILFERGLFGNDFFNVLYAITLHHPFWTGSEPAQFIIQVIPALFFLIPLLAFGGLYVARANKHVVFFGILSVLGIFLSKQSGEPFTGVYLWLFDHMPGFNAFREASKFYFIIAIGYSVLIAALVKHLQSYGTRGTAASVAIGVMFLANAIPLATGGFGTLFVTRSMPEDYKNANEFINQQPDYFRTLWIPHTSRWGTFSDRHPALSFDGMIQAPWRSISGYKIIEYYAPGETMIATFKKPGFDRVLDMTSIKYIVVPLADTANNDDFIKNYGMPRDRYVAALAQIPYLKRVDAGTKSVTLFENNDYWPKFSLDGQKAKIIRESPVRYEVQIPQATQSATLHFAESYDEQWRIKPQISHSKSAAGFNTYSLHPDKFKTPATVEVSFEPQKYVYPGAAATLFSLSFAAALFYYDFRKHNGKKKKR